MSFVHFHEQLISIIQYFNGIMWMPTREKNNKLYVLHNFKYMNRWSCCVARGWDIVLLKNIFKSIFDFDKDVHSHTHTQHFRIAINKFGRCDCVTDFETIGQIQMVYTVWKILTNNRMYALSNTPKTVNICKYNNSLKRSFIKG